MYLFLPQAQDPCRDSMPSGSFEQGEKINSSRRSSRKGSQSEVAGVVENYVRDFRVRSFADL